MPEISRFFGQELIEDWERAQTQQELLNIAPLT